MVNNFHHILKGACDTKQRKKKKERKEGKKVKTHRVRVSQNQDWESQT